MSKTQPTTGNVALDSAATSPSVKGCEFTTQQLAAEGAASADAPIAIAPDKEAATATSAASTNRLVGLLSIVLLGLSGDFINVAPDELSSAGLTVST